MGQASLIGPLRLNGIEWAVAGWDSTPCMSGLGKNNASGADRAGSVWIVGKPEIEIFVSLGETTGAI